MTVEQARYCMGFLEDWKKVTRKVTGNYQVITICKYDTYQNGKAQKSQESTNPVTGESQASHNPVPTSKNEENTKNGKNEKNTPLPPKGETVNVNHGFKTWTEEEFKAKVYDANTDKLLDMGELGDFISYWTEPSSAGRFRFALEKTWDTRRRMQTALRVVFEKRRNGQFASNHSNQGFIVK
jgi:hypothetical protein